MAKWIYVTSDTKLPLRRNSGEPSPFEEYPDGFDPNSGFPVDYEFMFLPVITDYTEPSFNKVHEYLRRYETEGVDGTYEGHYVEPNWVQEWEVVPRTLDEAKNVKLGQLNSDYQARLDQGFVDGSFIYELSEDFLRFVSDRFYWREKALAQGTITNGYKIAFTDQNGLFRDFTANALQAFYASYGKAYIDIYDLWVTNRNSIATANSLGGLDAIAWDFNAV